MPEFINGLSWRVVLISAVLSGCAVAPQNLTTNEYNERLMADLENLFVDQDPVTGPITVHEAVARAIKYNLDHRLKLMESVLAQGQLDVSRFDMLPQLTLDAGYSYRDNEYGSSSFSLLSGNESLEPSTSQERISTNANLAMVWNVLDFGVSYVQARQQGDQVLISEERRRKVVQNIVQDVRYAYWRAVSAERLLPKMDSLMLKAHSALTRAKMLEKMRLQPPLQSLNYQKALLEINRQMWLLRQDLASAKTELSTLMNLKPGTDYELVDGDYAENLPPPLEASIEKLEDLALHQRPELIEEHYQARISASEIRKVMLRMLPGLEFSAGTHTNSNRFLYNQDWLNAGYRISWNLFNLLSAGTRIREAETQLAVDEMRRLSLSMAILTQVRLAHQRYTLAQESYAVSSDMMDVETRIQGHMKAEQLAKTGSELEAIRSQASALIVEMQRDLGYAELQNAFSQIVNSLGIDPLQETDINGDIATLASDISNSSMLIGLRLLAAE